MKKILLYLSVLMMIPILFSPPVSAQNQSLTLSTYYPAPFGAYDRLRLVPRAAAGMTCNASTVGTSFTDSNGNALVFCGGDPLAWRSGISPWVQDGHNIYPADFNDPNLFVGIGTSEPEGFLHVYKATAGIGPAIYLEAIENSITGVRFAKRVGGLTREDMWLGTADDSIANTKGNFIISKLQEGGAGADPNRADFVISRLTGRIGIGKWNPDDYVTPAQVIITSPNLGTAALHWGLAAQGNDPVGFLGNRNDAALVGATAGSNRKLIFRTDNLDRMTIDVNGNVGIGTTEPVAKFHIAETDANIVAGNHNNSIVGNATGIVLSRPSQNNTAVIVGIPTGGSQSSGILMAKGGVGVGSFSISSSPANLGAILQAFGNTHPLQFSTGNNVGQNPNVRMTITPTGNVGIGTVTPDVPLLVVTPNSGVKILSMNTNAYAALSIGTDRPYGRLAVAAGNGHFSDAASPRDVIVNSLDQDLILALRNPTGALKFTSGGGGDYHSGSDTVKMIMTNNGNIGIGTSQPGYLLHVRERVSTAGGGFPANRETIRLTSFDGTRAIQMRVGQQVDLESIGQPLILNNGPCLEAGDCQDIYLVPSGGHVGIKTKTLPLTYALHVDGTVYARDGFIPASDRNLKNNIQTLDNALKKILQLRGVSFDWKEITDEPKKSNRHSLGVIAQEVETVFPELITTDANGLKGVNYDGLIAPLIEAIKEQQAQIEELKNEVETLKKTISGGAL